MRSTYPHRRRNILASLALICLALVLGTDAAAVAYPPVARSQSQSARWAQRDDHPALALFRREGIHARQAPPAVGSPEWRAAYPPGVPPQAGIPAAWTNALNAAIAANKIPNSPVATLTGGGPQYPAGQRASDPSICAASSFSCRVPGDIWDAPAGLIGLNFDDGPLPASPRLYNFLQQNNETATHFFIGTNILNNPQIFLQCLNVSQDIAVHTWTHPHMTTLSNMDVLAQLGWTMQIIFDSSDGNLPRFWRPPYGETDARVSAIAREVFGMTTVMWNQDTDDWDVGLAGGPTLPSIQTNFQRWLAGPKTPGLIVLEHELSDSTVTAFMNAYPLFAQQGWDTVSITDMFPEDGGAYQGADGDAAFGTLSANNAAGTPTLPGVAGAAPTSTAPTNSTGGGATGTADSAGSAQSSSAAMGMGVVRDGWDVTLLSMGMLTFGSLVFGGAVPFF